MKTKTKLQSINYYVSITENLILVHNVLIMASVLDRLNTSVWKTLTT